MSSAGQIIGGVVGAIAGFFMGGPAGALYGAQIGMGIGGYIDPPKGPNLYGPRLTDLSVQSSTYGAVIPRLYGTTTVYGNVFWIENNALKEKSHTEDNEGGKGGGDAGTTTTYSYYGTFAVGLCKGPIAGVRRIWIGSELWYDAGNDNINSILASNLNSSKFSLYIGSETQMPDSRMQATLGVSNTPAYRGLAYIVFKDLQLAKYGNSIQGAQVKVEVVKVGKVKLYQSIRFQLPIAADWYNLIWTGTRFVIFGGTPSTFMSSFDGVNWTQIEDPISGNVAINSIAYNGDFYCAVYDQSGFEYSLISRDGVSWTPGLHGDYIALRNITYFKKVFIASSGYDDKIYRSANGLTWDEITLDASVESGMIIVSSDSIVLTLKNFNSTTYAYSKDGINWFEGSLPLNRAWIYAFRFNDFFLIFASGGSDALKSYDGINWFVITTPFSGGVGRTACWDGDYIFVHDTNKTYLSIDGESWFYYASNDANTSYICAKSVNGMIFLLDYDGYISVIRKYKLDSNVDTLDNVSLSECLLSGLNSSDFDTSKLSQNVRGYKAGKLASIRSAIEPLRAAFAFDVIQSGYKVKFKPRNSVSVATVEAKDLAAVKGGSE